MDSFTLSAAIQGYEISMRARSLSENTIADYLRTLKYFSVHLDQDPLVSQITKAQIQAFLVAEAARLSRKSMLNRWIGLSAFYTWCMAEKLVRFHLLHGMKPPRPEVRSIEPLTEADVRGMLSVIQRSKGYKLQSTVRTVDFSLPYAERNRAIIVLLVDTGLRASELCGLSLGDVDLQNGHIKAYGKGGKERVLTISNRTRQAIWRYLATRENTKPEDPLFLSSGGYRLRREELTHTLGSIGTRAKVNGKVYAHRFRHTFAIQYLRNGGDVYTLQMCLGHTTMEMVRRYLALAQVDMDSAHRRASPAENWRL